MNSCMGYTKITISVRYFLFFFFQAEDGIRDGTVTGVQMCALPIAGLALPRTASHTQPRASSTKNPWPSHLIGCVSRFVRPCSGAMPAEPQTKEPPRYTP